jgi:hypothetical protein
LPFSWVMIKKPARERMQRGQEVREMCIHFPGLLVIPLPVNIWRVHTTCLQNFLEIRNIIGMASFCFCILYIMSRIHSFRVIMTDDVNESMQDWTKKVFSSTFRSYNSSL